MSPLLRPADTIDKADVTRGLRLLLFDGAFAQILVVLTTGAFLVGFALELGASNVVIGVIAAIGPLSQILQIPAIFLVEQFRRRKLLTVSTAFLGRIMWVGIAAIPWCLSPRFRIPALLVLLVLHFGLGNTSGCAYNSWMRDFVPLESFGSFFARRLKVATFVGAILSVAAALGIDAYGNAYGATLGAYSGLYLIAAVAGVASLYFIAHVPEPAMPKTREGSIWAMLGQPFRDANFRKLVTYLGTWNFAVNFAAPFFAVYMLKDLQMNMAWVIGLSVVSQMVNVLFYPIWGSLADRFTNKSVLAVSGPLFIVSFLIWPFTTMPDKYILTIPLLITIHVLAGISTAGVNLCAGNLALKLAPYGKATAYLAVNALISGVAATIAPILAGLCGDYFAPFELKVSLTWLYWQESWVALDMPTVDFRGLDFVFLMAFVFGVIATQRLIRVKEEGEVEEALVRNALLSEMRRVARQVSTVAGVRELTAFPYGTLKQWRKRIRQDDKWFP